MLPFENLPYFFEVLSFLFIFAVIYGLLDMSNVIKGRRVHALIAVVFAIFAITQSYVVDMIKNMLPILALILGIVFVLMFIKNLLGIKISGKGSNTNNVDAVGLVITLGVFIIMLTFVDLRSVFAWNIGVENGIAAIAILLMISIFYIVLKKA